MTDKTIGNGRAARRLRLWVGLVMAGRDCLVHAERDYDTALTASLKTHRLNADMLTLKTDVTIILSQAWVRVAFFRSCLQEPNHTLLQAAPRGQP